MSEIKSEAQLQAACHQWLWNTHPNLRGLFWMNHNDGNKSLITGNQDKARGLVKGVPDWCLMVPQYTDDPVDFVPRRTRRHGLFVEFKHGRGRLSPDQEAIGEKLRCQSYRVEVIRTVEAFQQLIFSYLA